MNKASNDSSIGDRISQYQEEIIKETEIVRNALLASETGRLVMESSSKMAESSEMERLMVSINDKNASEKDKSAMGQYMGQMLQANPENGLEKFAKYLDNLSKDPRYATRKQYFLGIMNAATNLNKADIFKEYTKLYKDFQQDMRSEAVAARDAMDQMAAKAKKWAGNNAQNNAANSASGG